MKLLIADDSKASRAMLLSITENWDYQVVLAEDGEQAWKMMQEDNAPRLLLLDWEMPGMNGIEVCESVIAQNPRNPPYIILLTARTDSCDVVEGLTKGANDYLSKPFDDAELRVRLNVGKRMIEMQNQLNDTLQELKILASHDELTGLLNRRSIMETLEKEVNHTTRESKTLYIGMCDIDHFKKVNDTYGHVVGDAVIKEVGHRMTKALKDSDMLGRYGGEEFLIISSANSTAKASLTYQRIAHLISIQPICVNNISISVTLSFGVTSYSPSEDNGNITKLITRADEALYQAKDNGRDQVVLKLPCH